MSAKATGSMIYNILHHDEGAKYPEWEFLSKAQQSVWDDTVAEYLRARPLSTHKFTPGKFLMTVFYRNPSAYRLYSELIQFPLSKSGPPDFTGPEFWVRAEKALDATLNKPAKTQPKTLGEVFYGVFHENSTYTCLARENNWYIPEWGMAEEGLKNLLERVAQNYVSSVKAKKSFPLLDEGERLAQHFLSYAATTSNYSWVSLFDSPFVTKDLPIWEQAAQALRSFALKPETKKVAGQKIYEEYINYLTLSPNFTFNPEKHTWAAIEDHERDAWNKTGENYVPPAYGSATWGETLYNRFANNYSNACKFWVVPQSFASMNSFCREGWEVVAKSNWGTPSPMVEKAPEAKKVKTTGQMVIERLCHHLGDPRITWDSCPETTKGWFEQIAQKFDPSVLDETKWGEALYDLYYEFSFPYRLFQKASLISFFTKKKRFENLSETERSVWNATAKDIWGTPATPEATPEAAPEVAPEAGAHSIREWQDIIHAYAKDKGWWQADKPRSFGDLCALFHSELSEAYEEYRNGRGLTEVYENPDKPGKLEGVPVELADCVIRILDFCGHAGIDLQAIMAKKHAYNLTREHRHGGKVT